MLRRSGEIWYPNHTLASFVESVWLFHIANYCPMTWNHRFLVMAAEMKQEVNRQFPSHQRFLLVCDVYCSIYDTQLWLANSCYFWKRTACQCQKRLSYWYETGNHFALFNNWFYIQSNIFARTRQTRHMTADVSAQTGIACCRFSVVGEDWKKEGEWERKTGKSYAPCLPQSC